MPAKIKVYRILFRVGRGEHLEERRGRGKMVGDGEIHRRERTLFC